MAEDVDHSGVAGAISTHIAPQGRFGLIDDPDALDIMGFNLKRAHALLEMGKARGKIVQEGF